jgi:hypothetical protein
MPVQAADVGCRDAGEAYSMQSETHKPSASSSDATHTSRHTTSIRERPYHSILTGTRD